MYVYTNAAAIVSLFCIMITHRISCFLRFLYANSSERSVFHDL